ncbi:VCBS repeat-containing protein [Streptomyces sp. NPDC046316]|uniref:FG-GAP repeat domain-containing protein n=1 Tax=Streptomyces sp. NPDC046316 TaxID=3154494 RepID=UPI0033EFAA39
MSVRRAVALALSAALGITGLEAVTAPAASAAADSPYEVKIDAPPSSTPPRVNLYGAGTGVQIWDGIQGHHWRSVTGGAVVHAPACLVPVVHGDETGCMGINGDAADATVHDFTTGVTRRRTGLDGHTWLSAFGSGRVLSYTDEGPTALRLLGIGENAPADLVVDLPGEDTADPFGPGVIAFDDAGALVRYWDGGVPFVGLLDFATGTFRKLPASPDGWVYDKAALSSDWIVQYGASATDDAFVVSRKDAAAPGKLVKLPADVGVNGRLGVIGGWIIGHYGDGWTRPLKATPVSGGTLRDLQVKAAAEAEISASPDGRLHVAGGTDSTHWGVLRVSLDGAGVPVTESVLTVPPQLLRRGGLTLAHGRVTTEHTDGDERNVVRYDVALGEPRTATQAWSCDAVGGTALNCPPTRTSSEIIGNRWLDTGDGRLVTLLSEDIPPFRGDPPCTGCIIKVQVTTTGPGGTTRTVALDTTRRISPARLLSASGRHLHLLVTEKYETRSVVADIETGKVLSISANTNQALWNGLLWSASTANDTVSAVDLRTGATVATVDLGTDCGIFELDVVGRWIYARCGDSTSAVVYDQEKKTSVRFQVSRYSRPQLGDGFVAYTETGGDGDPLSVTDVRSGAPVVRALGAVAGGLPNYNQGWTIDRFGGGVAFIDPQQALHVVGLGGATSRLTASDSSVPTSVNLKAAAWKPQWTLSKPGTWALTLKRKATGQTARTLTGEGRGIVAPSWDGKDAAGRLVVNGAHTWSLTVKPADGQGGDLTASGSVVVSGGTATWRDLAGDDGFGDLLVMDTAGAVSMYRGTGSGAVSARIAGTGAKFATSSVFVPVGDLNADRCADVYARVGDQLRAYRPGCGNVVSASSPYTLVGSGWGQYDVLTSPGDVNGDGYADLVVRQTSTGDMYFYAGTADHRVKARVRIGTNWKLYGKIVGAGDLNGDGRGDLLGADASGVLWRYHGTAAGGVTARVKVGGGWGVYSSLVGVGDVSGDGLADLLARDTTGKLWRYSGTGTGSYGARVLIGTGGWSGFKGLY